MIPPLPPHAYRGHSSEKSHSSRWHTSYQLESRYSTYIHTLADLQVLDAAPPPAINISNWTLIHPKHAVNERYILFLQKAKLFQLMQDSTSGQPLESSRSSRFTAQWHPTLHADDITLPPTTTEPRLLQPCLKARLHFLHVSAGCTPHTHTSLHPSISFSLLPPNTSNIAS